MGKGKRRTGGELTLALLQEMRRELLKNSDWNVVVVDWAGGSLPLYTQATANTRLVGLEVAYFVNYLQVLERERPTWHAASETEQGLLVHFVFSIF